MDEETLELMAEYLEKFGDHVPLHVIQIAEAKKIIQKAITDGEVIPELDERDLN